MRMMTPKANAQQNFARQPTVDWDTLSRMLQQGRVQEAYEAALSKADDDLFFIKLMGKTGICLSELLEDRSPLGIQTFELLI